MNREGVITWIEAYERAWRSPGVSALGELFTADAIYLQGPYHAPMAGLAAISEMWDAERDGPDEVFRLEAEIVAVDGDTAVVRAEVWYGDPVVQEYRDLWIIELADDGRCVRFEEWPFWPSRTSAGPAG